MIDPLRPCGCPENAYHTPGCIHAPPERSQDPTDEPTGAWRVFSDGDPSTTRVFAPDGRVVDGIHRVTWSLGVNELPELTLEVWGSATVVYRGAAVVNIECPQCHEHINHDCKGPPF